MVGALLLDPRERVGGPAMRGAALQRFQLVCRTEIPRQCAAAGGAGAPPDKDVTYLNVSPAPHTRPIIEAQGFARYCDGIFIAVPLLNGFFFAGEPVKLFGAQQKPAAACDPFEQEDFCCSTRRSAASACGARRQ